MRADLQQALRRLARQPGFCAIAVLSIALGLAANTAVFSFVLDVFLRPLPLPNPESLVLVWSRPLDAERDVSTVAADTFLQWQRESRSFEALSAMRGFPGQVAVEGGTTVRVRGIAVSAEFAQVFRLQVVRGRGFLAEDYAPGQDQVALLTHRFWQEHFGGDPAVVGQPIRLNLRPYLIVGVLAPERTFGGALIDVYVPHNVAAQPASAREHGAYFVHGRLKPGVSRAQAQAEMNLIGERLSRDFPSAKQGKAASLRPIEEWIGFQPDDRRSVLVLFVSVACVHLIVAANLANLLLARAVMRRREVAVRLALGARPRHVIRPILAEVALLAAAGAALGLLLAWWLAGALVPFMPTLAFGQNVHVSLDPGIVAFTFAATLLTVAGCGLLPAWQALHVDLNGELKSGSRGGSIDTRRHLLARTLVAGEIAMAVALVVLSSLATQSFWRLVRTPMGISPEQVGFLNIRAPAGKFTDDHALARFMQEALTRAAAVPGISAAAFTSTVPVFGGSYRAIEIVGRPSAPGARRPEAPLYVVSPDYGVVFGIPLRQGRTFTVHDRLGSPEVALINQAFAEKHFPGENPLGRRFIPDLPPTGRGPAIPNPPREIVGVIGNVKVGGHNGSEVPAFYLPVAQVPAESGMIAVRATGSTAAALRRLQEALATIDRDALVDGLTTMPDFVERFKRNDRHRAWLLGGLGLLALGLAALGVFGVISQNVNQRTREMGIRLALGASQRAILVLILRQAAAITGAGIVAGLLLSLALGRILHSLLFEVSAFDPWSLGGAALIMALVGLVAAWWPARRATRVPPAVVLRAE